ncbi:MAG: HPF/RaiA family ribosome-associated protein [Bacteroidota bacterium]
MTVPIEISYRDVLKTDAIDELIREKVQKLDRICDHIQSCRIAIEKPHASVKTGNAFRVRLDITVPPGHVIAVNKEPGKNDMHTPLPAVIRDAFLAAEKQLKKLNEIQKGNIKTHASDANAVAEIITTDAAGEEAERNTDEDEMKPTGTE